MQKIINIPIHSIIILIGTSNCGKTFFTKEFLIPQIKEQTKSFPIENGFNIQYISSDEIRRDLLGYNANKYDESMNRIGDQTFNLLFNKIDAVTSYPINSQVVIVDTTGLSKEFRQNLINISKKNNYNIGCIVFDYKNTDEYYRFSEQSEFKEFSVKKLISRHLKKLKTEALRELNKKDYKFIERIKSNNFEELSFQIDKYEEYKSHILSNPSDFYITIGDIHGCIEELKNLLLKNKFKIDENDILTHENPDFKIITSDYIDKGYAIKETIEFIHKNKNWFHIAIGNHENFVYKFLKGQITNKFPEEFMNEYFNSIKILEQDGDLKQKFFELFELSKGFFIHPNFVITHAFCEKKHIGKMDKISLKKQRSIIYPKRKDYETIDVYIKEVEKVFSFVKEDMNINHPYHITGHVAVKNVMRNLKNKINIDTGCVSGNKLTAIVVNTNKKLFFSSVDSSENVKIQKTSEELLDFFKINELQDVDLSQLEPNERGRIFWSAKNKVNFISGTISPSEKDIEINEMESLKKGLEYYKNKGIKKVMLQKKWMGSRCTLYLFKEIDKCYSTSRNGYLIKNDRVDMSKLYQNLLERQQIKNLFDNENTKMILIDGEIMPWSSLGKGLIEHSFVTVEKAIESEIEFLKENEFDSNFNEVKEKYESSGYELLSNNTSKSDLKQKFSEVEMRNYGTLKSYIKEHISLDEQSELISVYKRQLQLFGQDGEPNLKPFSILKVVYNDDSEKLFFNETNESVYKLINDEDYCMVDFEEENYLEKANEFFDKVTKTEELEGIVIKPDKIYQYGVAPYLKVRNTRYLTIVFGYDYLRENKYNKLFNRKSINKKLRTSIEEFEIGKKLLEIPYKDINDENKVFLNLIAKMILEERTEKTLDPRL